MTTLIHRNAGTWIENLLEHFPVVILQGGRQVGKSTLAGEIAASRPGPDPTTGCTPTGTATVAKSTA